MTEGLSFWNRPAGFVVLVVMLALHAPLRRSDRVGALRRRPRHVAQRLLRGIVLALPFGVVYLLYKSLTRRWRVLKLLSKSS